MMGTEAPQTRTPHMPASILKEAKQFSAEKKKLRALPHMGAARRQTAPQAPGALSNTPNHAPQMSYTHTLPEIGTLHAPEC